jgi:hypothetical protein
MSNQIVNTNFKAGTVRTRLPAAYINAFKQPENMINDLTLPTSGVSDIEYTNRNMANNMEQLYDVSINRGNLYSTNIIKRDDLL